MGQLERVVKGLSSTARERRSALFRSRFRLDETTRILDVGSEDGSNIAAILAGTRVRPDNVHIADIDKGLIEEGRRKFGFVPVELEESGRLPFADAYFDIVYCSSVIEHVTVPKEKVWSISDSGEFAKIAWQRQMEFAQELQRLGRAYFVQTPNRWFIVESHTWLPFAGWLPRPALIKLVGLSNRVWIKRTIPDWHLLTPGQVRQLFPEAEVVRELFWGMTKSVMAIKGPAQ